MTYNISYQTLYFNDHKLDMLELGKLNRLPVRTFQVQHYKGQKYNIYLGSL